MLSRAPSAPAPPMPERPGPVSGIFLGSIVQAKELSVVFQPIVSLDTGAVFACEALVRCNVKAYSNPETLIAEAVRTGCMGRLGRMIREVATSLCLDAPVFLNVHPSELHEQWLVRPDDPIYTHSSDVYLEITEAVPVEHLDVCHSVLREIRARGVHLVVDDLGAGHSNLKRISDLEPKVVKLDRELIHDLHRSPRQQRFMKSVVQLCIDMGASVVAEGIETVDELSAVKDAGVHYGQGHLIARPRFPVPEVAWPCRDEATEDDGSPLGARGPNRSSFADLVKPPDDPEDHERLLFVLSHHPAILAVVKSVERIGEPLQDVVVFLGDVRRLDFVREARGLLDGVLDLEEQVTAVRNTENEALCTHLPRGYVKKRLLAAGLEAASVLDRPASLGMVWVYAVTEHGRGITMVAVKSPPER